ncbi:hypothetical protein TNCV_270111 [Trichonephila clavipes]|nr:hypothetical protein TNCV_270111 [Trichonephila clavipes]
MRAGRFRKRRGESQSFLFRDADQESKTRMRNNALRTGPRQAVDRLVPYLLFGFPRSRRRCKASRARKLKRAETGACAKGRNLKAKNANEYLSFSCSKLKN